MYYQHTRGMATTRHRSLVERGGRRLCLRPCIHKKKCQKKPIFTNLKNAFEHIELPAKLLDYFLRSNKSNINQCVHARYRMCVCAHVCAVGSFSVGEREWAQIGSPCYGPHIDNPIFTSRGCVIQLVRARDC